MQQVELFFVALVLWGGIFLFLFMLYQKMRSLEKSVRSLDALNEE
jgi:hypothetical protein